MPAHVREGTLNDIDGTRPQATCTASLERTFSKRYLSVIFKLRNFESKNSGDATETSTWVDFISLLRLSSPLYI